MLSLLLALGLLAPSISAKAPTCNSKAVSSIDVRGIKVLDVSAESVKQFTGWSNFLPHTFVPLPVPEGVTAVDFCNVTVTYTHDGLNDVLHNYIWLPADDSDWNGRLLGEGGGGYVAALDGGLGQGVALGYAAAQTDGGHDIFNGFAGILSAQEWASPSEGNIDWVALQNFASRALDDLPKIAKQVVKKFYGKEAKKTYWHGCSTGGRQGLMSVQRYPKSYDGVLSVAPAINWATFLVTEQYPQLVMRQEGYYPSPCEFGAITEAAIKACDALDGVEDGLVTAPGLCEFDASDAVGNTFECGEEKGKVSKAAAKIANRIWEGPKKDGQQAWFGHAHQMPFGGPGPVDGLASTACDEKGKNCKPAPFPISAQWIALYLAKDPNYDVTTMTEEDFWKFLAQSRREFTSIMGTDDADISEFKDAGGKVILWHGLADGLIWPNGSSNYYERVEAQIPDVRSFFRYFEVPGIGHCFGGNGAFPTHALESLVDWVEKGVAPEKLDGVSGGSEKIHCVYPLVPAYKGGNKDKKESYECAESFDKFKAQWDQGHSEL